MITPDRRARMMLSCAIDGGDPAVAELVQNLGAEGAWAKIIEGLLGEPVAHRAARVTVDVFERLAAAAAARFIVPGDDEWPAGLMIFDMPRASSGAAASRLVCGSAVLATSLT
jgi:DNA processing protein